ncbi:hypothetical protein EVAR_78402_1 [Eumeta japonica]|uniref:Uncharacterized protein n=1 Tax=Eumeta variegata TaxID=151549 RepID=A0A4C1T3S3_EUMVA|nr:hypothetical protein EVAR_78402_1 [Eumeta japonica]
MSQRSAARTGPPPSAAPPVAINLTIITRMLRSVQRVSVRSLFDNSQKDYLTIDELSANGIVNNVTQQKQEVRLYIRAQSVRRAPRVSAAAGAGGGARSIGARPSN